jgi:hypothetical protein
VKEIIASDFKYFDTPFNLSQYIRGELYFYVDSIISISTLANSDDLPTTFEFMQETFELIFKWMDLFPAMLKTYNETMHNPNVYLVDLASSLASCGPELFDIFDKCFGSC